MLTLPDAIVAVLVPFATLFSSPTWRKAQGLLVGVSIIRNFRATGMRNMLLSSDCVPLK